MTDSLLRLMEPSSPLPSQLPESLDSMPPPGLPASKRRSVGPEATFGQMLASDALSLIGRSESPCFYRSSQPSQISFAGTIRASLATQSDTQDSQASFDDVEDREERKRQEEETLKAVETRQQKISKESAKSKVKTKPSYLPTIQKDPVEIDSASEEEVEIIQYKLLVESFWEGEKIAFNTEIEKRQLGGGGDTLSLYLISAARDGKAREHAGALGHVSCHRVSLEATPSHGALAAAKQRHFSVTKTV